MMPTIFLIGYMGCGKTTLDSVLAAVMNVPFVDLRGGYVDYLIVILLIAASFAAFNVLKNPTNSPLS